MNQNLVVSAQLQAWVKDFQKLLLDMAEECPPEKWRGLWELGCDIEEIGQDLTRGEALESAAIQHLTASQPTQGWGICGETTLGG